MLHILKRILAPKQAHYYPLHNSTPPNGYHPTNTHPTLVVIPPLTVNAPLSPKYPTVLPHLPLPLMVIIPHPHSY